MKGESRGKILAVIVTVIVGLAVVAGIVILDPPGLQRQRKLDSKRIKDLTAIAQSIDSYWERKKALPQDLATLEREPGLKIPMKDPETGMAYVYEITGSKSYRLCAVFSLDSSDEMQRYEVSRRWSHGAGRHCFDLKPPKCEDHCDEK